MPMLLGVAYWAPIDVRSAAGHSYLPAPMLAWAPAGVQPRTRPWHAE